MTSTSEAVASRIAGAPALGADHDAIVVAETMMAWFTSAAFHPRAAASCSISRWAGSPQRTAATISGGNCSTSGVDQRHGRLEPLVVLGPDPWSVDPRLAGRRIPVGHDHPVDVARGRAGADEAADPHRLGPRWLELVELREQAGSLGWQGGDVASRSSLLGDDEVQDRVEVVFAGQDGHIQAVGIVAIRVHGRIVSTRSRRRLGIDGLTMTVGPTRRGHLAHPIPLDNGLRCRDVIPRPPVTESDAELETAWFELIEDIGTTVWMSGLRSPTLEERCRRQGLRIVEDPTQAETVVITAAELAMIADLPDTTTVVCLASNRLRARPGNRGTTVAPSLLPRLVAATGVDDRRRGEVFGLLRSVTEPRIALSLRSPTSRRLVLRALALHVDGPRFAFVRLLARFGNRAWFAFPGWLVVAYGAGRADGPRVSGQFGYADNVDVTRFIGEPPEIVERSGPRQNQAQEAEALHELASTTFAPFVPRVVPPRDGHPGLSTTRLRGQTLTPKRLSDNDLIRWTEEAAATLALLQSATADDDGTVLVHGDFWLGNLIVDDDHVVGVFDWEDAHRGSPEIDRAFLTDGLVAYLDRDTDFAAAIRAAVRRGLDRPRT